MTARPARSVRLIAVATAGLAALGLLSAPAGATARPVASAVVASYALTRPICAAPTRPGEFTCMAYRRVTVAKGTPGARRYAMPRWARGPAGGYTPTAITRAYRINPSTATSQTVGIVDWDGDPHLRADLNHFDRHYGLPTETAFSLRIVNQRGRRAPLPAGDASGATEIALDVQAVRAVCHLCKIVLVEASNSRAADLARAENTAVRLGARIVSNSFGAAEQPGHPYPRSVVNAFRHKGVVTVASSGDNGWLFWDIANADPSGYAGYAPETAAFPAAIPSVVAVGGTRLTLSSTGKRASETVWNDNGAHDADGIGYGASLGATGGGCSTQFAAPAWQRAMAGYVRAGCHGRRLASDVSALGDPLTGFDIYDSYGVGGWATIGGTSLSAPLIAGMWALAGGAHAMSNPVRVLYQNALLRKGSLHDVTTGGNAWCAGSGTSGCAAAASVLGGVNNPNYLYGALVDCSFPRRGNVTRAPAVNPACNAVRGYDGPSGVGTPNGLRAFRPVPAR